MDSKLTVNDLSGLLSDKSTSWSQAIASRSALRALPIALREDIARSDQDYLLLLFKSVLFPWAALNDTRADYGSALITIRFLIDLSVNQIDNPAIYAVHNSILASSFESVTNPLYEDIKVFVGDQAAMSTLNAGRAMAAHSSGPMTNVANDAVWDAAHSDYRWLDAQSDADSAPRKLTHKRLWPTSRPPRAATEALEAVKREDPLLQRNFRNWIDWFERRLRGERAAFDIPGDSYRKEDKAILRRLAAASEKHFWDRGAPYVNGQLAQWLEEARERAAKTLQRDKELYESGAKILSEIMPDEPANNDHLAPRLQSAASPQATERDGKLDAGPNPQFDQPRFSGDLADLPSELRSFVRVLSGSLGENASRFMRSSLAEYENEMLVRGNRPILGTLKGLASAIAREVWTTESLAGSDDPDEWAMRDEREWGPGTADMFRTFFHYHRDLITHFPLDEEREELLRKTPINEIAASGDALTDPVELVTGLIRDLHGQGMATDDILKIVEAHEQYNANIATLPPPDLDLPSDYVTPKRRHVLMTAGFYLHLYSVLGSTASLASVVAANPALATQIQAAAEALLRFIV
ncbi:MAG: hypothetical protein R3D99_00810 [Altererythrobacter sp.]